MKPNSCVLGKLLQELCRFKPTHAYIWACSCKLLRHYTPEFGSFVAEMLKSRKGEPLVWNYLLLSFLVIPNWVSCQEAKQIVKTVDMFFGTRNLCLAHQNHLLLMQRLRTSNCFDFTAWMIMVYLATAGMRLGWHAYPKKETNNKSNMFKIVSNGIWQWPNNLLKWPNDVLIPHWKNGPSPPELAKWPFCTGWAHAGCEVPRVEQALGNSSRMGTFANIALMMNSKQKSFPPTVDCQDSWFHVVCLD